MSKGNLIGRGGAVLHRRGCRRERQHPPCDGEASGPGVSGWVNFGANLKLFTKSHRVPASSISANSACTRACSRSSQATILKGMQRILKTYMPRTTGCAARAIARCLCIALALPSPSRTITPP